jgi:hypothetical protein
LHLIGEASDGMSAVQKADKMRPDLILLDIGMGHLADLVEQSTRSIRPKPLAPQRITQQCQAKNRKRGFVNVPARSCAVRLPSEKPETIDESDVIVCSCPYWQAQDWYSRITYASAMTVTQIEGLCDLDIDGFGKGLQGFGMTALLCSVIPSHVEATRPVVLRVQALVEHELGKAYSAVHPPAIYLETFIDFHFPVCHE